MIRSGPIFGSIPTGYTTTEQGQQKIHTRINRFFANTREIDQRNLIRTTMSHESADGEECDACDSTNDRDEIKSRLSSTSRTLNARTTVGKAKTDLSSDSYFERHDGGGLQWKLVVRDSDRKNWADVPRVLEPSDCMRVNISIFPRLDRAKIGRGRLTFYTIFRRRDSSNARMRCDHHVKRSLIWVCMFMYVCTRTRMILCLCVRMKPPSPIIRRWKSRLMY